MRELIEKKQSKGMFGRRSGLHIRQAVHRKSGEKRFVIYDGDEMVIEPRKTYPRLAVAQAALRKMKDTLKRSSAAKGAIHGAAKKDLRDQILAILKKSPMTIKDLTDEIDGYSNRQVETQVRGLEKDGMVTIDVSRRRDQYSTMGGHFGGRVSLDRRVATVRLAEHDGSLSGCFMRILEERGPEKHVAGIERDLQRLLPNDELKFVRDKGAMPEYPEWDLRYLGYEDGTSISLMFDRDNGTFAVSFNDRGRGRRKSGLTPKEAVKAIAAYFAE